MSLSQQHHFHTHPNGDVDVSVNTAMLLLEDQLYRSTAILAREAVCSRELLSSVVWHPVKCILQYFSFSLRQCLSLSFASLYIERDNTGSRFH